MDAELSIQFNSLLKKLALNIRIKTITPAIISRVRGRSTNLVIRVSVKTINGYKAIARRGKTAQEVFISTDLSKDELKKLLDFCNYNFFASNLIEDISKDTYITKRREIGK